MAKEPSKRKRHKLGETFDAWAWKYDDGSMHDIACRTKSGVIDWWCVALSEHVDTELMTGHPVRVKFVEVK